MLNEITAYHGTDAGNIDSINKNGFWESEGESHWFGEGVYFFISGISKEPINDASKWAIASSWDKTKKRYTYPEYAVFNADIILDEKKSLDLRTNDGISKFNYARGLFLQKIKEAKKRVKKDLNDRDVIVYLRQLVNIEIVFANVYIRFSNERIFRIYSRIPNTTLICLKNPDSNIRKGSIGLNKKGNIPE